MVGFSRPRSKLTGLLAAVIISAGFASSVRAAEQRCNELGANCSCSEPFNTNSYAGPGGSTGQNYNPADSGSSSKECWSGMNGYSTWMSGQAPIVTPESAMPSGNSVNYVLTQPGNNGWVETNIPAATTQRQCTRQYEKFTSDYTGKGEGSCTNNKVMWAPVYGSAQSGGQTSYLEQRMNSGWQIAVNGFSGGSFPQLAGSGTLENHHDCMTQWCRFEVCVSGNVRAGTNLYYEGRIVGVSDGKTRTFPRTFVGNAPSAASQNGLYVGYREGTCTGSRSLSHVMLAEWPTDAGQWIGAAYEVEGGGSGGGGGTTTPPPAAPAPPVLLP